MINTLSPTRFTNVVMNAVNMGESTTSSFVRALADGDPSSVATILEMILYESFSCRMFDNEHVYQSFILGLIANARSDYIVTADHESGDGYHDIRMVSRNPRLPHVLIELKRSDGKGDADRLSSVALGQILDKRYHYGLEGTVHLYGIAFDGKKAKVSFRKIDGGSDPMSP